jgi:hypothetical protein
VALTTDGKGAYAPWVQPAPPLATPRGPALRRLLHAGWLGACLISTAPAGRAQDIELELRQTRWRLHIEALNAKTEAGEQRRATMLGLFYDWLDGLPLVPGSYLGVGGYGAVEGDLAGAFYTGLTAGWRSGLTRRTGLDLGLFVGAGGGGDADWGSGLVLRPHIALERLFLGSSALRLEVSYVTAPDGDVGSPQIGIAITDFEQLLTANWSLGELLPIEPIDAEESRSALNFGLRVLRPSSTSKTTSGNKLAQSIALASLNYERPAVGSWYIPVEVSSAVSGDVSGFLMALLGVGARFNILPAVLQGRLEALAGPAGGGGIDTGGGLYGEGRLGLETIADQNWRIALSAGYGLAPNGELSGWTLGGGLRYAPRPVELRPGISARGQGLFGDSIALETWSLDVLHRFVAPKDGALAGGLPIDEDLQLLGVGAERRFAPAWGLSMRAFGAYGGELAGYREGQVGLRYHLRALELLDNPGDFFLQYHLGSAGGAEIENGSGLLHAYGFGYAFRPWPALRLGLEAGGFNSFGEEWSGQTITLSASYDLTRPVRSN